MKDAASETTMIKVLPSRATKHLPRPGEPYPTTSSAREAVSNSEFAELQTDRVGLWFCGTLPIFVIAYEIYVGLGVQ